MVGKYSKTDLTHGGDSPEEHKRLRTIYEDLVSIGKAGKELSMIEQEFVYHGLEFLGENPNNFSFTQDARIKATYLTYGLALDGGGIYWTTDGNGNAIQVSPLEKENDLNYLLEQAKVWEEKVDPKHIYSEGLLKEVAKEAREDRKNLDKHENITERPLVKGTFYYKNLVAGTYLRAAANYAFGKKYWEETAPADLTFSFCGETIEFTEFTLIHILNRHFAERTKQYPSGKDYHNEDIIPWAMPKQVKDIMTEIDSSGLLGRQDKTEVNLRYKGETYQFWAEWKEMYKVGHKSPIKYKRIQSFYRATHPKILSRLKSDFVEVTLSKDLTLYVPR